MKCYDFVIAGGGAAGLSLALHLIHSPLRDSAILIVDRDMNEGSDRTWSFWSDRPTLFDDVTCRSWPKLHFAAEGFDRVLDLGRYRYHTIRGPDFYRLARQRLAAYRNVTFLQSVVTQIVDGPDAAQVTVEGQVLSGRWVFDSTYGHPNPDPARYRYLKLHFKGWEVETAAPVFDPQAVTLLDFRTPQAGETRFFYLLPFSRQRALVEYTLFSANHLSQEAYAQALHRYLVQVQRIDNYRIVREESGAVAITDQPMPRQAGQRIMTIGARGGRIKPTTGYAFTRIQQDSAAIVQSLLRTGRPFSVPPDSRRYRLYDTLLLEIMAGQGGEIKPIFTALFKNNPVERIFRFLDEAASPWDNLLLIASLPPWLFVQTAVRLAARRVIQRYSE